MFEVSLCFNTIMSTNTKIAFLDQTRFEIRLCSYMILSTDLSVSKVRCGSNVVYSVDNRYQRNEKLITRLFRCSFKNLNCF